MVKGCDEDSRPGFVINSPWGNDPIVAEVALKPSVVEKIRSMFGDLIMERVRGAEQLSSALRAGV